jgi:hypothetical protein
MESTNHKQRSPATVRAIARVHAGERPTHAARLEKINSSTLFRALVKERPGRMFLLISQDGGRFIARTQDQRHIQRGRDEQFSTVVELQAALPGLLAKTRTIARLRFG